jgi:hypothetical protein
VRAFIIALLAPAFAAAAIYVLQLIVAVILRGLEQR